MRCSTLCAWLQELTRQETHLYVHACTAVPPHFLPLVATHLQLPARVCLAAQCSQCHTQLSQAHFHSA